MQMARCAAVNCNNRFGDHKETAPGGIKKITFHNRCVQAWHGFTRTVCATLMMALNSLPRKCMGKEGLLNELAHKFDAELTDMREGCTTPPLLDVNDPVEECKDEERSSCSNQVKGDVGVIEAFGGGMLIDVGLPKHKSIHISDGSSCTIPESPTVMHPTRSQLSISSLLIILMCIKKQQVSGLALCFHDDGGKEEGDPDKASGSTHHCIACRKKADQKCSSCRLVYYCASICQKSDWSHIHRDECGKIRSLRSHISPQSKDSEVNEDSLPILTKQKLTLRSSPSSPTLPYKMEQNEELGRYLVATKDLEPGEVIFMDEPLVVGPVQGGTAMCLGCYKRVTQLSWASCHRCNMPLCSVACEDSEQHLLECSFMSVQKKRKFTLDLYSYVTILRAVILKLDPVFKAKWEKLSSLESHLDKVQESKMYAKRRNMIVKPLRELVGDPHFPEEEIQRVCSIFDINAFEIHCSQGHIYGLYPTASLMEHSCIPNTYHTFDRDFNMVLRAAEPIAKGSHITAIYTRMLEGTMNRRRMLKEFRFFECSCPRCADPLELGSYFSAVRCGKCPSGYLLPQDPLEREPTWVCESCEYQASNKVISRILRPLEEDLVPLERSQPTVDACEAYLKKYGSVVHPNHYLLFSVLHSLSQLYGRSPGRPLHKLTAAELSRKEDICRHMIQVADILDPGISLLRGVTLYELQATLFEKARRLNEGENPDISELRSLLSRGLSSHFSSSSAFRPPGNTCDTDGSRSVNRKAPSEGLIYLSQSIYLLQYEPGHTPEGQMKVAAIANLEQVSSWVNSLQLDIPSLAVTSSAAPPAQT
ncbi:unnamed protein product [Darwinula stevensoni]|uniref:Uncharacterized protein n=1 Tax=Darwinula stevensoni TaxID=69355 RepID=A0A7R9A8M0_9CRUS|nr:unnamed protein product [Darwinula stevensoni]CAG0896557.1 unnamed protein product [Darwinula stevensoni]